METLLILEIKQFFGRIAFSIFYGKFKRYYSKYPDWFVFLVVENTLSFDQIVPDVLLPFFMEELANRKKTSELNLLRVLNYQTAHPNQAIRESAEELIAVIKNEDNEKL